jgi:thiol-disulfide isomerase/thioredoxin
MLGWDLRRGRFIDCEALLSILGVPGLIAVASPLPATIPAAQPPEQDDTLAIVAIPTGVWNRVAMATVDLTEETFEGSVRDGIAFVDWWAGWCGPCRMFAPVFHAASEQHADITFGKVDTEAERQLAAAAQIRLIPT